MSAELPSLRAATRFSSVTARHMLRGLSLASLAFVLIVGLAALYQAAGRNLDAGLPHAWVVWPLAIFGLLVLAQAALTYLAWGGRPISPQVDLDQNVRGFEKIDAAAQAFTFTLGELHPSCFQRLQHLMKTNIVGVATLWDDRVEDMNDAMLRLLSLNRVQLRDAAANPAATQLLQALFCDSRVLADVKSSGLSPRIEIEIVNLAGETKTLAMMGSRLSEAPFRWALLVQDISDQRALENKLRGAILELNHRNKNLLMVVQSVARMSFRTAANKDAFLSSFSARLQGLGASQNVIVVEQGNGADLADLVRSQVAHLDAASDLRITIEGPPVVLRYRAAQAIGMAIHELATNAIKYGALHNDKGHVRICWTLDMDADFRLALHWMERDGPRVEPPAKQGFGSSVIERLTAAAVSGTVAYEFKAEGVEWTLQVPSCALLTSFGEASFAKTG